MLLLHEVHHIRGATEEEFEAAYRDELMPALARDDDSRLLWYCHHAHGSGPAYHVVTISALRDGASWERLARRVHEGDLRAWARRVDELRHDLTAKLLVQVPWSPMGDIDLSSVPTEPVEHELSLYMEDTGWPHAAVDDYVDFWERSYYAPMAANPKSMLRIEAVFRTAFGTGRRKEAVLMQKVVDYDALLRLLTTEVPGAYRGPGTFMSEALAFRDRWESKLLRTSAWSPLH
ncbi:MAG TPA: hypothetical protein VE991_00450 [Acidimicrobiales bacterium]|nr:hypothetical protein [Acidimicrobiales bacterium]